MAGRFPGARDVDEFWENLADGRETITHFTSEALLRSGIPASAIEDPDYVQAQGVLEGIEMFDAAFFGFTPAEAAITAPEHRLLMECAWEALESAGRPFPGQRVGVFAGVGFNAYLQRVVLPRSGSLHGSHLLQVLLGNEKDQVTTRVAYKLDLRGPSITVQTGCSTSLVAVHLACQSLLNGECDMALAGGASISVPQISGYVYQEGGIFSPDGHCRAFDADAKGTVPGNGAALVLLKRADDALADRDVILAFIRGTAVNNDGAEKVGYAAPGPKGQAAVIAEAVAVAGVEPDTVGYIETNGTGTAYGDPIEIGALKEAYRSSRPGRYCAIGSVKSNIGHLGAAAGVTGLIKAALALKKRAIPASLHFIRPNPEINFADSPFFVNTELRQWPKGPQPRRAAVSAFGIGGTNAHVILEEAPEMESAVSGRPYHLLVFSAKCRESLNELSDSFIPPLKHDSTGSLADIAYTLQTGRRAFSYRRAFVCRDKQSAAELLSSRQETAVPAENAAPPVAFLFPGEGRQYAGMSREIYDTEPAFRAQVDYCADFLANQLAVDLRALLYPDPEHRDWAAEQLDQTSKMQPALFVIEYGLAKLWMEWGVHPAAMIGHGVGEYTAACIAGVFSLEDALTLVCARGRLMQLTPEGAMLAVSSAARELGEPIGNRLSIASDDDDGSCVISGPREDIAALREQLNQLGIGARKLKIAHALHSAMTDPILGAFEVEVMKTTRMPPRIPYVSNVTGDWITPEQAVSSEYWRNHLRQTVRFREGRNRLQEIPCGVLLEVGPGRNLSVAETRDGSQSGPAWIASMRIQQESVSDAERLMEALGLLWRSGVNVDWNGYWKHEARNRVTLPTYPFRRQRHWIDSTEDQPLARNHVPPSDLPLEAIVDLQLRSMVEQLEALSASHAKHNGTNHGEVPPTPVQKWFFDQNLAEPNHVNHSVLLDFAGRVDVEVVRRAFLAVVDCHEALRTQYRENSSGWYGIIGASDEIVQEAFQRITLPAADEAARFSVVTDEANRSLNLRTGPLLRLLMFDGDDGARQRLLLVCHHLLVDFFSWQTLARDLEIACTRLSRGEQALLPPASCSYAKWTKRLQQYARSVEARRELPFWLSGERRQAHDLPLDYRNASSTEGSSSLVTVMLTPAETESLVAIATRVYESPVCDIFLTALSAALIDWAGGPVMVDIEGHGREDLFPDLDSSRIVGWLTAIFPLLLDVRNTDEPERAVRRMRDKRQDVPFGGAGYGALRYLSEQVEIVAGLSALPPAQVSFNYEVQPHSGSRQLFARTFLSSSVSPMNKRTHLLNVQVGVRQEQFYILLSYSTECHRRRTIEKLATTILDALRGFVEHAIRHRPARLARSRATRAD